MKSSEVLLDLNTKNPKVKLGRVLKKNFSELRDVHAKVNEGPAPAPAPKFDGPFGPVAPKGDPAPVAPAPVAPAPVAPAPVAPAPAPAPKADKVEPSK